MPSFRTSVLPGHEEWVPTLYIYFTEEEIAYQKKNPTNGTNF
jgi:hypothetical protein